MHRLRSWANAKSCIFTSTRELRVRLAYLIFKPKTGRTWMKIGDRKFQIIQLRQDSVSLTKIIREHLTYWIYVIATEISTKPSPQNKTWSSPWYYATQTILLPTAMTMSPWGASGVSAAWPEGWRIKLLTMYFNLKGYAQGTLSLSPRCICEIWARYFPGSLPQIHYNNKRRNSMTDGCYE